MTHHSIIISNKKIMLRYKNFFIQKNKIKSYLIGFNGLSEELKPSPYTPNELRGPEEIGRTEEERLLGVRVELIPVPTDSNAVPEGKTPKSEGFKPHKRIAATKLRVLTPQCDATLRSHRL